MINLFILKIYESNLFYEPAQTGCLKIKYMWELH